MYFDVSQKSLLMMLREIFKDQKGKRFKVMDKFDPAWGGLLRLIMHTNAFKLNKNTTWPSFHEVAGFVDYVKYISGTDEGINYFLDKWKEHAYIQLWMPFLSLNRNDETLQESFNSWIDLDKIKIIDDGKSTKKEKDIALQKWKIRFNDIFSLFSEVNANSTFHGLNSKTDFARKCLVTGFILVNKDFSWDIFHADIGTTIIGNIKDKSPEKVAGFSDKEIIEWAAKNGNTSKSKKQYPISGGGISVLKKVCLEDNSEIFCISGDYVMKFKPNNLNTKSNDLDDLINVEIQRNDFKFPGTIWMLHINKASQVKKVFDKNRELKQEESAKKLAEIKKEIDKIIKEYII